MCCILVFSCSPSEQLLGWGRGRGKSRAIANRAKKINLPAKLGLCRLLTQPRVTLFVVYGIEPIVVITLGAGTRLKPTYYTRHDLWP